MEICFYNMNHIGDIYFSSIFVNFICKSNKNMNFLYYCICGDIFYEKIPNIQRINRIEQNYFNNLKNGNPPEELINGEVLNLLIQNNMQKQYSKFIEYNNKNILFVNTWCASNCLHHTDYDLETAVSGYERLIQNLNSDYNLNLNLEINLNNSLNELFDFSIKSYDNLDNNSSMNNLEETIFIFNYRPRSENFDINFFHNFILVLSKNYKLILSCYDSIFDNNENIKFIDKDFNIYPDPKCLNLTYIWEIASKCNKIILLNTGSSWTFLHKIKMLNSNQLFLFYSNSYFDRLNKLINILCNENKNLIGMIDNTNINSIFTNYSKG